MSELSNYKYIKTIGEGTFGKVKLAIHILTGEKVAIKILQKNLIKGPKQYERIQNEIKYLKLLNHPNIIKIYEVIENELSFFIVMEYATGGELFNYIVLKEKLSENETSFFFYQIIQGVRKIHEKKICHRDIKPENLLLAKNNIIKIIDFGLSSEYDEVLSTPCGSPCYASPEMIKGQKYKGLSIDLWACGVILFAMLFGYLPFDDKDNNILFKKILDCEIDYPEENEIDIGKDGIDLINKILNPEPEKRITLDEVENHPFLEYGKKEYEKLFKPENFTQEELIINYMTNELGFDNKNNTIENDIYNNRHNHVTTTYYLLKQKCLEGRLIFSFRQRLYQKICNKRNLDENKTNNFNINSNDDKKIENENENIKINIENHYQNIDENIHKKSKKASKSESKNNILSLKDIFNQKEFSDNRNNIIIINNTNMIHEPEKINSIYNNIILKKNQIKNINKNIETSVSQEKRITENRQKIRNSTYIKSANTYRSNFKKNQIKVSLKKVDKKGNKFIYFKKINTEDNNGEKKYIKLPLNKYSYKTQKRNINDIFSYKKNSPQNQNVKRYINNIHSFDGNNSNNFNFNTSISNQNLNAFSSFDLNNITNGNFNATKIEEKSQKNMIKKKLITNNIFDSLQKNKFPYKIAEIKLDLNKKISLKERLSKIESKNKNDKKKDNYSKNIEKIYKIIFPKNNTGGYINYINNDKKINNDNTKNKEHKINEVIINLDDSNEIINPNSSRYSNILKSINSFNINKLNNKIIDKNILAKKINCYFIPNNKAHVKEANKNNTNLLNNNNKIKKNKKIQSFKNLSPDYINNITYENLYMNSFKKVNINKTNKINTNFKNILSPTERMQKNRIKYNTNIYNNFNTERDSTKIKNNNYIPITSRDRKTNHSRNEIIDNNNSNSKFESKTVFLDLAPNSKNNFLKGKKDPNGGSKEIPNKRNSVYSKQLISNQKKKNGDKFLVANTEMTLYQIVNKISIFCKENNLNYKKEGLYNIKIFNKNYQNFFNVEILHSSPMNIVKIIRGKNTGNNMKDYITKLFLDIINFE